MRLVLIPLLAALVGVSTLSPQLAAAEGANPPHTDRPGVVPGDTQTRLEEAQRQLKEAQRTFDDAERQLKLAQRQLEVAQRRHEAGNPKAKGERGAPGDAQARRKEAQGQRADAQRRREAGKLTADGKQDDKQDSPEVTEAQVQERIVRLKDEQPALFKRLDLDNNSELSSDELRGSRELFRKRQQAGDVERPDQVKGAERSVPSATANETDVAVFLFNE